MKERRILTARILATRILAACLLIASVLAIALLTVSCRSSALIKRTAEGAFITLPISGEVLEVEREQEALLSRVSDESIRRAEEALSAHAETDPSHCYYLTVDDEGSLCLSLEVIRSITPPMSTGDEMADSGCGIDHEHLFYSERISE